MFKKFVALFIILTISILSFAQQKKTPTKSETKTTPTSYTYSKEITQISNELNAQNLNTSIQLLTELLAEIKDKRQSKISELFPEKFNSFEIFTESNDSYFSSSELDYGVLFTRMYKNKENNRIQVNVVFEDSSVQEYIRTINDPKRVKNLGNAKVITLQEKYKALEKFFEEDAYLERNIVLNEALLVNIITTGVADTAVLDAFINTIKLNELTNYLQ